MNMRSEFDMTSLGTLSLFLGMEFVTTKLGIVLHQKKYVIEVLWLQLSNNPCGNKSKT